jgi:LPS sulfotransferase NodH
MPDGTEAPSVDIEPLVDNNELEAEVCKDFLKSDAGRLAKIENAAGYRNVLLHMKRHMDIQQAMMAMQPQQQNTDAGNKPAIAQGTPDEHVNSEPGYAVS